LPKLHEETGLHRLDENPVRVLSNAGSSRLSGTATATHFVALVLPLCSRPSPISGECPTPFREPLHFIVIAVMSVMGGTFPDTYRGFYMTVN